MNLPGFSAESSIQEYAWGMEGTGEPKDFLWSSHVLSKRENTPIYDIGVEINNLTSLCPSCRFLADMRCNFYGRSNRHEQIRRTMRLFSEYFSLCLSERHSYRKL